MCNYHVTYRKWKKLNQKESIFAREEIDSDVPEFVYRGFSMETIL